MNNLHTILPVGFETWLPPTQAVALALLTLVQEDVPAVTAGILAAAGNLGWTTAWLGCFFGIWIGDALLYLLARTIGRPLLATRPFRHTARADSIARSERWFAEKGDWLLLSSRCVPGARLPTYLAAGFLKAPFHRFLLITALAVAFWTTAIFLLAGVVGPNLLKYLAGWNANGWMVIASIAVLFLVIRYLTRFLDARGRRRFTTTLARWKHWEFWPAWLFYFPVALNYLRLALIYRGWTVPTAANPAIFSGGFVGESKIATLRDLHNTSPLFTAEAWLLDGATREERIAAFETLLVQNQVTYPCILKPDAGHRGVGVKLIRTHEQARSYLNATSAPLLLQRYAPGPHEIGIFYYRFPHEKRGRIFTITEKVFPTITGDGIHSIEQLIWRDPRARFLADKYLARLSRAHDEILPQDETLKLVEAGNHAQGCIFRDGMHLWSPELDAQIDWISQRLNSFFIGRYDIRYSSHEDLRAGRNFQIIELNGAASEATSIYDARNSLFNAYKTLFRQWELVFAIGSANRQRGTVPTDVNLLWRKWRETSALIATCPLAD